MGAVAAGGGGGSVTSGGGGRKTVGGGGVKIGGEGVYVGCEGVTGGGAGSNGGPPELPRGCKGPGNGGDGVSANPCTVWSGPLLPQPTAVTQIRRTATLETNAARANPIFGPSIAAPSCGLDPERFGSQCRGSWGPLGFRTADPASLLPGDKKRIRSVTHTGRG